MNIPWIICGTGIFFCLSGLYFFFKNVFEENRSLKWPVLLMVMGIVLISVATAKIAGLA
ncbi:MAG: hypothetical protein J0I32_02685 [Sphingobacteriales bacterium]|jgi:hypothetical protein|nr:hypothetical protein [Sphingobacteriales bacterium]